MVEQNDSELQPVARTGGGSDIVKDDTESKKISSSPNLITDHARSHTFEGQQSQPQSSDDVEVANQSNVEGPTTEAISSGLQPADSIFTARGQAAIDAAVAMVRSDSVLSEDEEGEDEDDDSIAEDDDEDDIENRNGGLLKDKSFRYMQEASIEVSIFEDEDVVRNPGAPRRYSAGGRHAEVKPSGKMGRRRSAQAEAEVIVVSDDALDGRSVDENNALGLDESRFSVDDLMMDKSVRDRFRSYPKEQSLQTEESTESESESETSPRMALLMSHRAPSIRLQATALDVLIDHKILDIPLDASESTALFHMFEGFCFPPLERQSAEAVLELEKRKDYDTQDASIPMPDHPVIVMHHDKTEDRRVVALLKAGSKAKPALLELPLHFSAAFLRILIRILSEESDFEYNETIFALSKTRTRTEPLPVLEDPLLDADNVTRRPHLMYSVARFRYTWSMKKDDLSDSPVVADFLKLWERALDSKKHRCLLPPLARVLGLLGTAGFTPRILRRMLSIAQSSSVTPKARLSMVRAIKTAALGSTQSSVLSKAPPRNFFCFGGQGLSRTITGLPSWPFRNDFGMALWFRAEHFHGVSARVLVSARDDDDAGVEVSLVKIEGPDSNACTIAVSVYDAGVETGASHIVKVSGCVLLPRVWYHLAIRHNRSRLKGVFSLSTRQQLSVMLDGKNMLTESLPFPKFADTDPKDDASLLVSTLRRNSTPSIFNLTINFGHNFDGQTGALYVFNDSVSDASFRALFESTGGAGSVFFKRASGAGEQWDARRSDIVRRSRVLDVNITNDDADEIVLSKRRPSGVSNRRMLNDSNLAIVDFGESDEQEENTWPTDLQKASFGGKIFVAWDPRRVLGPMALELHVGAHLNMEDVVAWTVSGAQDIISSIGGVQSLVPLFRSFLGGDFERTWTISQDTQERQAAMFAIPDLLKLLSAFIQDHSDNSREMLRCGGVDVIEHLLHGSRKATAGKLQASLFRDLNADTGLAFLLADSLLQLRSACAHYSGLETKVFARLLFNIPLWFGAFSHTCGNALHAVVLPILSYLTRVNPGKVRDCVGVRDMVYALKGYINPADDRISNGSNGSDNGFLGKVDRRQASDVLLAMIFDVLASGTSSHEMSPFLNFLSARLDRNESHEGTSPTPEPTKEMEELQLTTNACTVLLFLMKLRPPVPGLFESFAELCGGSQAGAGWILGALVDSSHDEIRSLGIHCLASYLDATSKSEEPTLSLAKALPEHESSPPDLGSPVLRASQRFGMLAKGLAAMGPGVRSIVLPSSKMNQRVILKLLWHLLKSHRNKLGSKTRVALLSWITDDNGVVSSSVASPRFVREHFIVPSGTLQRGYRISAEWANSILAQMGNIVGKSLTNPMAVGVVLRLIRFLESDMRDLWLADILTLAKSSRRSMSLLASLPEFQPALFQLVSETLELANGIRKKESNTELKNKGLENAIPTGDDGQRNEETLDRAKKRLDRCLELYSTLLGHLVREGGDKALEAVEKATSLQRICVNGHDVLLLTLSGLCADIFDHGTLLEMGSISAEDWRDVDLEQDSLLLKQSARLVTDAILSKGTKGLEMTAAVRSWRSLRHLTEVVVAVVTKSGFGAIDLFDYKNHQSSAIDEVSGGLHGIRLPDGKLTSVGAAEYFSFLHAVAAHEAEELERDLDRRLCVTLAGQILTLLDAFIFPESSLDEGTSQMHGLALVRNSEARLGTSQGPLISSAIRLSFLLMALLEPCSVKFLQCASRLRCLLLWALELVRESSPSTGKPGAFQEGVAHVDRLLFAIVLHSHRALSRCAALLSEIESSSFEKYFGSRDAQKKHHRRLLRVALELRDIVSTAYRGRNEVLRTALSTEAYAALRVSLEGALDTVKPSSKESVIRDFLASTWVAGFQDIDVRKNVVVPEQASMETIPINSNQMKNPALNGSLVVEHLAEESSSIVFEFEKAINGCFEEYLEEQRLWAETDAVRDLEYDGDTIIKKSSERHRVDENEIMRSAILRRGGADNRWRGILRKAVEPWLHDSKWKLARYTDRLGRRTLLVQNRHFTSHEEASYDLALGKEREQEERARQKRLLEKKELSEVMRRNADAFVVAETTDDNDDESLHQSIDGIGDGISDGESSTDLDAATEGSPLSRMNDSRIVETDFEDNDQDDEWHKIDSEEVQDAEGDIDGWAKTFIWSDTESVVARFDQVMIVSLQAYVEGKVLLTTHGLYFQQVGDEINAMTKEPLENSEVSDKGRRWRLSRLVEVHGRRYMLRPQALELFFSDSHELFLNFPSGSKERDRFHAKLRNSCKVPMLWSPKSLNPRTVFRRSKLTDLWQKRKISNFAYLMALNRMAGRSFNDITQYPVFPWILNDYTSETLDLTDTRVYRDLTKPIGALNPDRLAQLLERYKDLELFGFTEAEKFLYGSHYSSPGIVLHFLIRQEPFTTMAIELQSGRFDCPDRLFFDIASSWEGCMTSTSDMKELIPEFFYLPEMFLNTNKFPLGTTQSGRSVDSVGLPPWAKGSAYEFIRIHRLALESEYVSQNLHHWIDLIFGYKQRGPEAEAAHNIFHHLSYEGSVDLDKIVDQVDRQAAESHIQNFGQTPSQLAVADPHPSRYAPEECWRPLIYDPQVPKQLRCHTPLKQFGNKRSENAKGPVLKIHILSDSILAVYADLSIGSYRWFPQAKSNRLRMDRLRVLARRELSTSRHAMKRGSAVSSHRMDESTLLVGNWSFAITLGGLVKEELRRKAEMPSGRLMSGSDVTLSGAEGTALLLSCGYWDETLKIHGSDSCRLLASESGGHRGPIRCMAMGQDGALMATGGQDSTVRVWVVDHPDMAIALSDGYVQTALGASHDGEQVLSCCHVLWGHDSPVICVDLDSDMDAVVSGSELGVVCVHTARRGEFVRSFRPPALNSSNHNNNSSSSSSNKASSAGRVSKLALGKTSGSLAIHMQDGGLHTFTINGVRLCSTDAQEQLNDMKICSNDQILVTGGMKCQVLVRTVVDLQVCAMLDLSRHGPIRCISMTPDDLNPVAQFLFIGSDDGMLTIVDHDPNIQTTTETDEAIAIKKSF